MHDRPELRGASLPPAGLSNALDEERAASMADEGGRSGMYMEQQEPLPIPIDVPWGARPWLRPIALGIVTAAAVTGLTGLATWLFARRRLT